VAGWLMTFVLASAPVLGLGFAALAVAIVVYGAWRVVSGRRER
jgi:hypothetical protein